MENTVSGKKRLLTLIIILGLLFLSGTLLLLWLKFQSESMLKRAMMAYCRNSLGLELPGDYQLIQRKALADHGFYAIIQLPSNTMPALSAQVSGNSRWMPLPVPANWVVPDEYSSADYPIPVSSTNGYYFAESWGLISISNDSFPCCIFSLLDLRDCRLFIISRNVNKKE
jgi:hypothetical protein